MLFFLCSLRRDQRVSVSTDGLCYKEKVEGIPIYHTDCVNQQGRFWWTAWNRALGPMVFSPGAHCVASGQVQSSLTMASRTTILHFFTPCWSSPWKRSSQALMQMSNMFVGNSWFDLLLQFTALCVTPCFLMCTLESFWPLTFDIPLPSQAYQGLLQATAFLLTFCRTQDWYD